MVSLDCILSQLHKVWRKSCLVEIYPSVGSGSTDTAIRCGHDTPLCNAQQKPNGRFTVAIVVSSFAGQHIEACVLVRLRAISFSSILDGILYQDYSACRVQVSKRPSNMPSISLQNFSFFSFHLTRAFIVNESRDDVSQISLRTTNRYPEEQPPIKTTGGSRHVGVHRLRS